MREERRDYIERQIEQILHVIRRIGLSALGIKTKDAGLYNMECVKQTLKGEIDLDLDSLQSVDTDKLIDWLRVEKGFNNESLDKLTEVLLIIADNIETDNTKRNALYKRILVIYEYLEKATKTFSVERNSEVERIKTCIRAGVGD